MKVKCSSRGRRLPNTVPFAFYTNSPTPPTWTVSSPVRAQTVFFIPLHARAYQPPILGQPSPFRVSGPETRSRPPTPLS
jgi:hypothetical protein